MNSQGGTVPTSAQQAMSDLWDEHMRSEFETSSVETTLETMVEEPYVNHVPVIIGGVGLEEVRAFYAERFITQPPPETDITPVSRTIGNDRVVDELIYAFTHAIQMDWLLPVVPPTGKRIEVPMAVVVEFWDGKIASEHIYWDQATVLVQAGLIDGEELSVSGAESARKVLDPASVPSDGLMDRAVTRSTPDTNSGRTATPPRKGLYLALPVDSRSRRNDGGEPSLHPQPDSTTVRPESVWALPIRAGETIIRKLKAEPEAPC